MNRQEPPSRSQKKTAGEANETLNFWQIPTQARPFIYIIKKGDTLNELAEKYHVTLKRLLELNPHISNADNIVIGTKLFVPGANENFTIYQPPIASRIPASKGWEEISINVEVNKEANKKEKGLLPELRISAG